MNKHNFRAHKRRRIIDIEVVFNQHMAGFTIRELAEYWEIPYTSLRRAILERKGRDKNNNAMDNDKKTK